MESGYPCCQDQKTLISDRPDTDNSKLLVFLTLLQCKIIRMPKSAKKRKEKAADFNVRCLSISLKPL